VLIEQLTIDGNLITAGIPAKTFKQPGNYSVELKTLDGGVIKIGNIYVE
jgi:hypothetical protein